MKKEWFDKLSEIDKANEAVIGIHELIPYIYNRTLLYGYTCERETFHVYIKDQKIYTVVYNTDYSISYEKELGSFMRGDPRPKNMRQIEIRSETLFLIRDFTQRDVIITSAELLKKKGLNFLLLTGAKKSNLTKEATTALS